LNHAVENKYRFNGGNELQNKEFSDGSGLDWYDATFRMYDPQIGRFHQIDELADIVDSWSPYTFSFNTPILFNDPLGLLAGSDTITLPEVIIVGKPKPQKPVNQYAYPLEAQPTYIPAMGTPSTQNSNSQGLAMLGAALTTTAEGTGTSVVSSVGIPVLLTAAAAYLLWDRLVNYPSGLDMPSNFRGDNTHLPPPIFIIPPLTNPPSIVFSTEKDRTAQDIISKDRKGSINSEFPDQYRDKTLDQIEKAAKQGQEGAKKALKLLKDGRFKK
ncbi:MAG: hypothetical protein J0I84_06925, partial [Terrimonas sp.]|nr:hypothetical protein [Terrimonas sp.]